MTPQYVAFGNIFIDDIVLSDGTTFMATLGGASAHALGGMRLWTESLGIVAVAGPDLPDRFRHQLAGLGVDLQGIRIAPGIGTTHAWQLFEPDGRRTEVFRSAVEDFFETAPDFEDLPAAYYQARGYHLYWDKTCAELPGFLAQLRRVNPRATLIWEPAFHHFDTPPEDLQAVLPHLDHFSPDVDAALAMTATDRAEAALDRFLAWGATSVSIRMGAAGSLLGTASGDRWHIPAIPAQIVDVTGAGNAYCGGLLVGLAEGQPVLDAAQQGAVSASFAIEQFGVADFGPARRAEADRRRDWVRQHSRRLA
jgi:sugar/nucleoside kinase (ribokinase family)